jgi:hypothetical protein
MTRFEISGVPWFLDRVRKSDSRVAGKIHRADHGQNHAD